MKNKDNEQSPEDGLKLIAFDCDGVLFDSANANRIFYNRILAHLNKPRMTEEQFVYSQMHTADQALAYLFDNERELAEANAYRKKTTYMPFIRYMEMDSGLIPLLKRIRPEFKTAVATNRTDTMAHVLKSFELEPYFDLVVCAHDVDRPKPYPDVLLRLLDHFNITPPEMIYVGDSELDEKAALAAGVPLIACRNRSLASAIHHIDSLTEIAAIVSTHAAV